jgi:hypothetical protein
MILFPAEGAIDFRDFPFSGIFYYGCSGKVISEFPFVSVLVVLLCARDCHDYLARTTQTIFDLERTQDSDHLWTKSHRTF